MTAPRPKSRAPALDGIPLAQRADALLDHALELGALPASTTSLLALTRKDDAEVGPVVDALALNASLAAVVLRTANSAAYGQARSIGDLRRAVTVVGMQELHDLIAGTAMMAAFSVPDPLSARIQSTAVLSASVATKVAAFLKVGTPSSAYLSGLMCELGALACLALDSDFADIYDSTDGAPRLRFDGEAARYGGTTPDIGGRILAASALPPDVAQAVATTGLEPGKLTHTLGRVVAFARLAAHVLVRGAEHGNAETLRNELAEVANTVGLENVDPEKLMQTCLLAATAAELTLRGELGLAQTMPANDVQTQPTHSTSAAKKGWLSRLLGS